MGNGQKSLKCRREQRKRVSGAITTSIIKQGAKGLSCFFCKWKKINIYLWICKGKMECYSQHTGRTKQSFLHLWSIYRKIHPFNQVFSFNKDLQLSPPSDTRVHFSPEGNLRPISSHFPSPLAAMGSWPWIQILLPLPKSWNCWHVLPYQLGPFWRLSNFPLHGLCLSVHLWSLLGLFSVCCCCR